MARTGKKRTGNRTWRQRGNIIWLLRKNETFSRQLCDTYHAILKLADATAKTMASKVFSSDHIAKTTLSPPPSPEQMAIEKVKRKCSNFLEFLDDFLHSGPIHFKKPNKFLIIVGLIEKSNHCRILRIYTYLDRASVTFYILEKPLILKEKIHRV